MRRFKFFINYDKEEKWLNSMAERGYELKSVFFGYVFQLGKPQKTTIKIDFRQFSKKKDFVDYCTLFEDSGWKHVAGTGFSGTQYFKKISENCDEDIFSDKMSKAARYKRMSDMWMQCAMLYLVVLAGMSALNCLDLKAIFNPKLLYLTPGLWEKQGTAFWNSFWFETPFAIFRGALLLIPVVTMALYGVFYYKAQKLYKEEHGHELN